MFPPINSCSILYTLFAWFLGMCYGFVLLSSAAGQNGDIRLFETGQALTYRLHSTIFLNEKDDNSKGVGFYIAGDVVVRTVWGNNNEKLLKVELKSPQLNIQSRKAPSPDGFIPHSSKLDNFGNKPFVIVWTKGKIEKVLLPRGEPVSLANLKKGIASLFQFQHLDGQYEETDTSGKCSVTYTSLSATKILKTKSKCVSHDFQYVKHPDEILSSYTNSSRQTEYELDNSNFYLKSIKSKEVHQMYLLAKEEIGLYVQAEQTLEFVAQEKTDSIKEENVEKAIERLGKSERITYTQETLFTEQEAVTPEDEVNFSKQVDTLRDHLKSENLGTLKPARAFLKLVNTARQSNKESILKTLDSKKNKQILPQLYDILGYVQTQESHEAVMKKLFFDKEEQTDLSERYLWALSFSSQPSPEIIKDLIKKYTKLVNIPEKVKETLILTIAAMTQKLQKLPGSHFHQMLVQDVEELISNNLDYAQGEDRYKYFRALKNLQSKSTIPLLLNYIKNGTQKEGVLSWKAIASFDPKLWNKNVLKAAEKCFFQLDRRYDTSSRTLAADILMESNPNDELLEELLKFLVSNDPAFEIKQYVFQRIKMKSEEDYKLKERIEWLIKKNDKINNYSGLSPRGLSVSLSRNFLKSSSSNGSLVSVQEIKNGIVKRGIVNIVMDRNGVSKELFSLGIFSGGLHSFVSSGSEAEEEEEEESATAGMELTVLNTQIRPFVFFDGQGELMGHVWSGTASEKTTAFQVLALLHDHLEYLRLGPGFIVELSLKGATSFDLSGKIEISLWNRNAESLVEKSAGIVVVGSVKIDTSFVKSQVEFSASIEPKLNLQTDINFSSDVNLCMRLTQPDSVFKQNIFKIERIPGSKHKLRISKYKKFTIPGTTYALNKKNNEMCSAIFK